MFADLVSIAIFLLAIGAIYFFSVMPYLRKDGPPPEAHGDDAPKPGTSRIPEIKAIDLLLP